MPIISSVQALCCSSSTIVSLQSYYRADSRFAKLLSTIRVVYRHRKQLTTHPVANLLIEIWINDGGVRFAISPRRIKISTADDGDQYQGCSDTYKHLHHKRDFEILSSAELVFLLIALPQASRSLKSLALPRQQDNPRSYFIKVTLSVK